MNKELNVLTEKSSLFINFLTKKSVKTCLGNYFICVFLDNMVLKINWFYKVNVGVLKLDCFQFLERFTQNIWYISYI